MSRFPKIPRGKDFWSWPPVVLTLAVLAGFLAVSAARIVIRQQAVSRERRALEKRVRELQAQKTALEESIRVLGSPEAVERLAKEKLNLKNPGEEVVVVRPETAAASTSERSGNQFLRFLPEWISQLLNFLAR